MATEKLEVEISLLDRFSAAAKRITGTLNGMNASAGRVGKGVGQVSAGLLRVGAVAAGAAAGGIAAVAKAGIDFEDAFAGVRKTLDATPAELDEIALKFRKLATEIPISANELSRIGEIAGQLGIKAQDITEFTKTVALLGVAAPQLGTEEAAFGLSRILTLTGQTTDQADELASAIVDLGNNFATTEPAIIETAERFASVANAAGIGADGVLGLAAAVTALGGQPQEAGTSLQRSIQKITLAVADGGKELALFAETAGMTTKNFAKAWEEDALGTFQAFLKGLGEVESNVERTKILDELGLSDARLGKTILNLATAFGVTEDAIDTAGTAIKENTALTAEAEKRFATLRSQIELLKNNLIEGALVVYDEFSPALGRAIESLKEFLQLPSTKKDLRNLGQDIARFLDSINWSDVLNGAKTFLGLAKDLLSVISKIPIQITGAIAAFAGLNTLSGGLIGEGLKNIIAGLGAAGTRGIAARVPGVGRIFAQPVYVTNWAMMGGGPGIVKEVVAGVSALALGTGALVLGVLAGVGNWLQENFIGQVSWPWEEDRAFKYDKNQRFIFDFGPDAQSSLDKILEASRDQTDEQRETNRRLHGIIERDTSGGTVAAAAAKAAMEYKYSPERYSALLSGIESRGKEAGYTATPEQVQATFRRLYQHRADVVMASDYSPQRKLSLLQGFYRTLLGGGAEKEAAEVKRSIDGLQDIMGGMDGTLRENLTRPLPAPIVTTTVNVSVTGREVVKSTSQSTSYGASTSSYYGGTVIHTGLGGSAIL